MAASLTKEGGYDRHPGVRSVLGHFLRRQSSTWLKEGALVLKLID